MPRGDGVVGYLKFVAQNYPSQFCQLLGKVLPLEGPDYLDGAVRRDDVTGKKVSQFYQRQPNSDDDLKPIQRGKRPGRKLGGPSTISPLLKKATLLAAEESEHPDLNELVPCLTSVADEHPVLFCKLLARLFPVSRRRSRYATAEHSHAV